MTHHIVFTPDPDFSNDSDDWCWEGTWKWICDCNTTHFCRWTSYCDCEEFSGMEIAKDGSLATHTHYDDEWEEIGYPMTVADQCQLAVWFYEDDKEGLKPPRPGRHEVTAQWMGDYYDFRYKDSTPCPTGTASAVKHDPLCRRQYVPFLDNGWRCDCELIHKARADQTERCVTAMDAVEGGYSVPLGMSVGMFVDAMRSEYRLSMRALLEGEKP